MGLTIDRSHKSAEWGLKGWIETGLPVEPVLLETRSSLSGASSPEDGANLATTRTDAQSRHDTAQGCADFIGGVLSRSRGRLRTGHAAPPWGRHHTTEGARRGGLPVEAFR